MICADIDGTLIDKGISAGYFSELKKGLSLQEEKVFYSQWPLEETMNSWESFGINSQILQQLGGGSGIIWSACLFLGRGRKYVLGGLDEPVLTLIKETVLQYPVAFDGLVGFPNKFK